MFNVGFLLIDLGLLMSIKKDELTYINVGFDKIYVTVS